MATGLLRPDRGQVWVDGIDVWTDPIAAKARIGVLPEDLALFERLRGRELLEFHGLLRNMPIDVIAGRSRELLDLLGLSDAADTLVVDYSHGMRKKLVLAAAMLHGPRLLFLDEPFEAIDPVSARAIRSVLEHFTGGGGTIVFSSHVMELVERMCDHVAVMVSGRIALGRARSTSSATAARSKMRSSRSSASRRSGKGCRGWNIRPTEAAAAPQRPAHRPGRGAVRDRRDRRRPHRAQWVSPCSRPRGETPTAPDLAIVVFAFATLGWTVLPILGFGNDETLDPQRLATLPLTRRQLVTGVLAASLLGVAPLATLVALSGAFVGLVHNGLSAALVALAIAATLLLCVVASRTLVALLVPVLRSRRGRDFTILAVTLLGLMPPAARDVRGERPARLPPDRSSGSRTGCASHRSPGAEPRRPTRRAATTSRRSRSSRPSAALTAALLWVWSRALERGTDELGCAGVGAPSGPHRTIRRLIPRALPVPPPQPGRRGRGQGPAVLRTRSTPARPAHRRPDRARGRPVRVAEPRSDPPGTTTLLGVRRDPARGRAHAQPVRSRRRRAVELGRGGQRPALRPDRQEPREHARDGAARDRCRPSCAPRSPTAGPYLPLTLGLAPAIFGVLIGVGDVMSVRVPYAMPDRRNPMAFNPGQGCATMLAGFGCARHRGRPAGAGGRARRSRWSRRLRSRSRRSQRSCSRTSTARRIWVVGRNMAWRAVWWRLARAPRPPSPPAKPASAAPLRSADGSRNISVQSGAASAAGSSVTHTINTDPGELGCFPGALGLPVCTATVELAHIGLPLDARVGATRARPLTSAPATSRAISFVLFGDTPSPYCWYGPEPHAVRWTVALEPRCRPPLEAHSFLATTPLEEVIELGPRRIVPHAGFSMAVRDRSMAGDRVGARGASARALEHAHRDPAVDVPTLAVRGPPGSS